MDFIGQLKAFDDLGNTTLTPNEVAIYLKLFMLNNRLRWQEWFEATDHWLMLVTGIKRHETITNALNRLSQKGFIEMDRGGSGKPSKYHIVDLYTNNPQVLLNSTSTSTSTSTSNSTSNSTSFKKPPTKEKNININGNRNNSAPARKKFVPPTLDEINAYIMERGLHVSAKDFWDYFTVGNWIDKNGVPVKNWKQKLLTWEKFQPTQKKTRAEESQAAADRAIAFFEEEEGKRNGEGSGDNPHLAAVFPSIPESGNV